MEGRSDLSIDSGLKVSKYVPIEQIKQIPFLEFFHTVPLLSYIRFGKWDQILNYPKPIDEFSYSNAIYHYARSSAYAALKMSDDANVVRTLWAINKSLLPNLNRQDESVRKTDVSIT